MTRYNKLILLILIFVLVSCTSNSKEGTNTELDQSNQHENHNINEVKETIVDRNTELNIKDPNTDDNDVKDDSEGSEIEETSEFSIHFNDRFISLKDRDDEVDIYEILGSPISEDINVLSNAATLTGSSIKTLRYDGLEMELFSPSQNGKSFWVLSMMVTSEKYSTTQNVVVGDSLQKLEESYPNVEIAKDGRTDPYNCAYMIEDVEFNYHYIKFEVEDGIVKEINIYHEIN